MDQPTPSPENAPQRLRLLRTKTFMPRAHPDLVPRARLLEALDAEPGSKLVLVAAPAGFGKTALLCRWVETRSLPAVWLSLDERSNNPVNFVTRLAAALQELCPAVKSPQVPTRDIAEDGIIQVINALADAPGDFVLILDNYQVIESPLVSRAMSLLLDYPPPHLHLIIATQVEPSLPLSRLQVRRQLLRLRL